MATYNGHQEDASGNILLSIGNGMTATLETGSTASQAYTKGAYIFFNNKLCKASTAITSGATLAIGTNLTQTSIGAELTSHLRATNGDEFYFDYKDGKAGYYPSASKTSSQFVPFGGTLDEGTTLWENPNKTSTMSTTDITLNDSLANYSYIAVDYKLNKSDSSTVRAIMSVSDFAGTIYKALGLGSNTTNGNYARVLLYRSNTSATFGQCFKLSSSTSTGNGYSLPIYVKGIK